MEKTLTHYVGGFAKRLNAVMDTMGLPDSGRYTYIKQITGMEHSNSRSIFLDDRPQERIFR
jgi:hypothetical protein